MINDQQVKKLRSDLNGGMRLAAAALRSGMSEKTARKYRNMNQLPSEAQQPHHWRTRIDPFESVWDEIQQQLQQSPENFGAFFFACLRLREEKRPEISLMLFGKRELRGNTLGIQTGTFNCR